MLVSQTIDLRPYRDDLGSLIARSLQ